MGSICGKQRSDGYVKTQANFQDMYRTYDIDKNRLGKGSFGVVYKATNKKDKKQVTAIKQINKRSLTEEEVAEIHDEVKLIQKCDHANIVNYYETYEDSGYIYLCMELCTGGELVEAYAREMNESHSKKCEKIAS